MSIRDLITFRLVAAAFALVAGLAVAGPTLAQSPPDSTLAPAAPATPAVPAAPVTPTTAMAGLQSEAPTSMLRGGPLGELMSVYPPRSTDEVGRQLDHARDLQRSAQAEIAGSRELAAAAEGRVRIMSEELETTKTRLGVAKKLKNEADRAGLQLDVEKQQAEKKYLERLRDALKADASALDRQEEAARARVKALELELDVARRHAQLSTTLAPTEKDVADYRGLLKKMLDAQSDSAARWKAYADKAQEVADRRLKQMEALSKLATR